MAEISYEFLRDIEDYIKNNWQPHIVDPLTGDVVSEGTRFTSKRANHFEEGIWVNRELHKIMRKELLKLRAEMDLGNRVPGGKSFYDIFTDDNGMQSLEVDTGIYIASKEITSNKVSVNDAKLFTVGLSYFISDDTNSEIAELESISGNTLTFKSIKNKYRDGALLSRYFVKRDEGMHFVDWQQYKVEGKVL